MTTQEIIKRLKDGNARFVDDLMDGKLQNSERREQLLSGQEPYAVILSCADSRVVPEFAFDAGLGELFVVRVAGNIANSASVASIEYVVEHLECKVLVVLGHESCGAVTAAIQGGDHGPNLNHLLGHIHPAIEACGEGASIEEVVKMNSKLTIEELKRRSEILRHAIDSRGLKIVDAYYNLNSGKVDFLDE